MTALAPPAGPALTAPSPTGSGRAPRRRLRRVVTALLAVLLLAALVTVALVDRGGPADVSLDPDDAGPDGARALVHVLRDQGVQVDAVRTSRDLPTDATTTILVTGARHLSEAALDRLASAGGPLVLVVPDGPTLRRLAPRVEEAPETDSAAERPTPPRCDDPDATAAGAITWRTVLPYAVDADAAAPMPVSCYPLASPGPKQEAQGATAASRAAAALRSATAAPGDPSLLVRSTVSGRHVDVLGAPDILSNDQLAREGDAALALRLTGRSGRLVWYVPTGEDLGGAGDETLTGLIPPAVRWGVWQLLVVCALALFWAGRREGRLVTEPLPVVVRASETEQGRARLYVRAGARGRSAAILRTATLRRLARRFDVPPGAEPGLVASLVAAQTGRATADVARLMLGPPPQDDATLLALAHALDELEREVGESG